MIFFMGRLLKEIKEEGRLVGRGGVMVAAPVCVTPVTGESGQGKDGEKRQ